MRPGRLVRDDALGDEVPRHPNNNGYIPRVPRGTLAADRHIGARGYKMCAVSVNLSHHPLRLFILFKGVPRHRRLSCVRKLLQGVSSTCSPLMNPCLVSDCCRTVAFRSWYLHVVARRPRSQVVPRLAKIKTIYCGHPPSSHVTLHTLLVVPAI